jgi:hypothetical protein
VKLKRDGSKNNMVSLAGCGGLLGDSDGKWLEGYSRKLEACDDLHARYGIRQLLTWDWTLLANRESNNHMSKMTIEF